MITKNNFLKILGNSVLIGDGAMGTVLQGLGIFTSPALFISKDKNSFKILPDVHLSYLKSGSDIIQASTFGANPVKLESEGLLKEVLSLLINKSGLVKIPKPCKTVPMAPSPINILSPKIFKKLFLVTIK